MRRGLIACLLVCLSAGCGKSSKLSDAGGGIDAMTIDGGGAIDAAVPDANLPFPAYEITGGAARVTGAHHVVDVQIGHGIDQSKAVGSGHAAEGNAAVKP